jgi:hypothetical protein
MKYGAFSRTPHAFDKDNWMLEKQTVNRISKAHSEYIFTIFGAELRCDFTKNTRCFLKFLAAHFGPHHVPHRQHRDALLSEDSSKFAFA